MESLDFTQAAPTLARDSSLGGGSVFGEMALFATGARSAKVVAERDCALMAVNRGQFMQLTRAIPDIGLLLLKVVAQRLQTATAPLSH